MMHSDVDTRDEQPPALGTHHSYCLLTFSQDVQPLNLSFLLILASLLILFPSLFTLCHILSLSLYLLSLSPSHPNLKLDPWRKLTSHIWIMKHYCTP